MPEWKKAVGCLVNVQILSDRLVHTQVENSFAVQLLI